MGSGLFAHKENGGTVGRRRL